MRRVSLNEIATATGLSRATIDRALNGRGGVHARTQQLVRETLRRLSLDAPPERNGARTSDPVPAEAVLRLGRGLLDQFIALRDLRAYPLEIADMHQKSDDEVLEVTASLCRASDRPLIVCAKNTEALRGELERARKRGKVVISFVSELSQTARDAHVGIDNRMAGHTAAYLMGSVLGYRPAKVGVVLGDYAFRCYEDREIGFRSYLRSAFPDLVLADVAKGEDSAEQTHRAVSELLRAHPDISALYNVGGGNLGLARAVSEADRERRIHVITHEVNSVTIPLLERGELFCVIAQDAPAMLDLALRLARDGKGSRQQESYLLDFGIYTRFNIPHVGV